MPLELSALYEEKTTRSMTQVFGGMNKNLRCPDGEFFDMKNLTSDHSPVLAVREKRYMSSLFLKEDDEGKLKTPNVGQLAGEIGIASSNDTNETSVAYIDGTVLYFGNVKIDLTDYGYQLQRDTRLDEKRRIIKMGAYLIIVPDMIYVNTIDESDKGKIEDSFVYVPPGDEVSNLYITVQDYDGNIPSKVGAVSPEFSVTDGQMWIDTSNPSDAVLRYYEADKRAWTVVSLYDKGAEEPEGATGKLWVDTSGPSGPVLKRCYFAESGEYEWEIVEDVLVGRKDPTAVENGTLWLDTSQESAPVLKRYAEAEGKWYEIESYLNIWIQENRDGTNATVPIQMKKELRAGDAVTIDASEAAISGQKVIVKVKEDTSKESGTQVVSIVVKGILDKALEVVPKEQLTIERVIPAMDYVCECGNRLWGCRYGSDGYGNFVNEIYCSARGDFFRWILGEAADEDAPVTFSVGRDGFWTGCVNYGGYPTFFKESCMIRVSGYGASSFSIQETPCVGVQQGAYKSMATVNNVLYYKSGSSIMAYDGTIPVSVSEKLGRLSEYNAAVGGACGHKYYVSLMIKQWDENGRSTCKKAVLMVLDTRLGTWHKEDETECGDMATNRENLYFVEIKRQGEIATRSVTAVKVPTEIPKGSAAESAAIPWYAETGIIGLETPDAKYVSKLALRMQMDTGSMVRVLVQYDSDGVWKQIAATQANRLKTTTVPVIPARCDHMRLRLEGVGGCKVYSITRTIESGEEA